MRFVSKLQPLVTAAVHQTESSASSNRVSRVVSVLDPLAASRGGGPAGTLGFAGLSLKIQPGVVRRARGAQGLFLPVGARHRGTPG